MSVLGLRTSGRRRPALLALLCCVLTLQSLLGPLAFAASDPAYTPTGFAQGDFTSFGFGTPSTSSRAFANALASVDPSSGAARASLPFELAPARGGLQPQLALSYDSSNGDREGGIGWALSLPGIERRSPSGLARPLYQDPPQGQPITPATADRFLFAGQPLVPICVTPCAGVADPAFARSGWHYYSLQLETGPTLRFWWSPDHRTWVMQDKAGNTSEFGAPLDGNYDAQNGLDSEQLIVANDFGPTLVPATVPFRWNLVRQYDANRLAGGEPANPIVYVWNGAGKRHTLADIFDTPPATAWPGLGAYAHHTHLSWSPLRYLTGRNTPTWRSTPAELLSTVDVTSLDATTPGARTLVRRHHLRYDTAESQHSVLYQFQVEGRCAGPVAEGAQGTLPATDCPTLPPVTLSYNTAVPTWNTAGQDMHGPFAGGGTTTVMDVNADGLPDFVSTPPSDPCNAPCDPTNFKTGVCGFYGCGGTQTCYQNCGCSQQPLTVYLNSGQDLLGQNTGGELTITGAPVTPPPLSDPPGASWGANFTGPFSDLLTPGASYFQFNLNDQISEPVPGIRAYAGDMFGDGSVSLLWFNTFALLNGQDACSPPSVVQWPLDVFTFTGGGQQWRMATTVTDASYANRTDQEFQWVNAGDIDGDGYMDRMVFGRQYNVDVTPGKCYNNGNPYTLEKWNMGVEFTARAQDGTVLPFGVGPLKSHTQVPYTPGPLGTAPACKILDLPWFQQFRSNFEAQQNAWLGDPPPVTPAFTLADMDGDGLEDVVVQDLTTGAFEYYPGRGDGYFGLEECTGSGKGLTCTCNQARAVVLTGLQGENNAVNPYYLQDVTGDGYADLIQPYLDRNGTFLAVYQNVNGTRLAEPRLLDVPMADFDPVHSTVTSADVTGDGVNDIVVITNSVIHYYDFFGGDRPYLLNRIDNGLGATTTLTYDTVAHLSVLATLAGNPWGSQSAQSQPVVTRVETSNGLGLEEFVDYVYRDPVYDFYLRRFRGFRTVATTLDGDQAAGSQTVTTTYAIDNTPTAPGQPYGAVDDPYEDVNGLPLTVAVTGAGGSTLSIGHTQYSFSLSLSGIDGRNVYLVYPSQQDEWLADTTTATFTSFNVSDVVAPGYQYINRSEALPVPAGEATVHLRQTRTLQGQGNNLVTSTDYGVVQGPVMADDPIVATYDVELQGDAGNWSWRTQSRAVAYANDDFVRQSQYSYDAAGNLTDTYGVLQGTLPLERRHEDASAATALPPGDASADGLVHLQHRVMDAQGLGNVTLVQTPDDGWSGCTRYAYDTASSQYPTTTTLGACGTRPLVVTQIVDLGLGKVTKTIDQNGAVSSVTYDGLGRPIATYQPDPEVPGIPESAPAIQVDYSIGPLATRTHVRTRVAATGLAPKGTAPYRDAYAYVDGTGRPLATLTPGDTGGWILSGVTATSADGRVTRRYQPAAYGGDPSQYDVTAPGSGPFAGYSYDSFARPYQVTALDGSLGGQIVYRPLVQVVSDADDLASGNQYFGTPQTVRRDGHGRVVEQDVVGASTRWSYLATGELTGLQRSGGYDHEATYDTLGRLVENDEPNAMSAGSRFFSAHVWRYAYNDAGRLVGTSDPRGCGENLVHDDLGRLLAEDYSPCTAAQALYTPYKSLTGDGAEASYTYDAAESGDPWAIGNGGYLTAVADRGAHTRLHHDQRGRVVEQQRQLSRPDGEGYAPHWFATQTGYDELNEVTTQSTGADVPELLVGGQSVVSASYTARGLTQQVSSSYGPLIVGATYAPDGLPVSIDYGVARAGFQYDALRRLHEKTLVPEGRFVDKALGSLEDSVFSYDAVGNPTAIVDERDPTHWPTGAKPVTRSKIGYDEQYHLTHIEYASGSDAFLPSSTGLTNALPEARPSSGERASFQGFTYDSLGNTIASADDSNDFFDRSLGTIQNGGSAYAAGPNQLASAGNGKDFLTASYDQGGNLADLVVQRTSGCTASGGACTQRFSYTWDEVGRMGEARRWDYAGAYSTDTPAYPSTPGDTPDADAKMLYDAAGHRVAKAIAGAYFAEIFPSLRLDGASFRGTDYERNATTESPYLVIGSSAVGRVVYDGTDRHLLLEVTDELGSTSTVLDATTGALVERSTYLAYGQSDSDYRTGAVWERYRFTGKEEDVELGLSYFGARYYSPMLGRWLSADPLAVHGFGADANPYAYVGGSVLAAVDPDGLCDEVPCTTNLGQTQPDPVIPVINPILPPLPPPPMTGCDGADCASVSDAPQETPMELPTESLHPVQEMSSEDWGAIGGAVKNSAIDLGASVLAFRPGTTLSPLDLFDSSSQWHMLMSAIRSPVPASGRPASLYWGTTVGVAVLGSLFGEGGAAAEGAAGAAARFATTAERAGVLEKVLTSEGTLNTSQTVARQLAGPRGFIPVQSILDTIGSGARIADPQGVAGQFMYRAGAAFNGSEGTLEVLVDEASGQINHVLFRSGVSP